MAKKPVPPGAGPPAATAPVSALPVLVKKRAAPNLPRCQKPRKDGQPCQGVALSGKDHCRMHGGVDPGPVVSTGSRTRFFPSNLIEDLQRALADPDLLSLRLEIAALEARETQIFRAMEGHHAPSRAWEDASRLYVDATTQASPTRAQSMQELGELITHGLSDAQGWSEIYSTMELRRKLQATEAETMAKLDQFLTKKQAAALGAGFITVLRKYIPDPNQREMAVADVARLFTRRAFQSR